MMIDKPPPAKGLSSRIPIIMNIYIYIYIYMYIIIPISGRGFINEGSELSCKHFALRGVALKKDPTQLG